MIPHSTSVQGADQARGPLSEDTPNFKKQGKINFKSITAHYDPINLIDYFFLAVIEIIIWKDLITQVKFCTGIFAKVAQVQVHNY